MSTILTISVIINAILILYLVLKNKKIFPFNTSSKKREELIDEITEVIESNEQILKDFEKKIEEIKKRRGLK